MLRLRILRTRRGRCGFVGRDREELTHAWRERDAVTHAFSAFWGQMLGCWGASVQARSRVNELLGQNNPRETQFPFVHSVTITNTCNFLFFFLKLLLLLVQGIPAVVTGSTPSLGAFGLLLRAQCLEWKRKVVS